MISLAKARKALGKNYEDIADGELLDLLVALYQLAELAITAKNNGGSN